MQGFATLLRRRLTLKIRASLKTQQKLFILHPTDLRRPYKLVVVGRRREPASRIFEPHQGRHRIARVWSRAAAEPREICKNNYEPRRGGIMLRFELRHYMYPPYLSHALCHPSTGVPVCLSVSPGFRRCAAPHPGYPISPLTGALISAGIRPQGIPTNCHLASF